MTLTKIIAIATSLSSVLVIVPAHADSSTLTMKPVHGLSFDIGSERAVSYFSNEDGRCNVVITHAGQPSWDDAASFTPTRFETAIQPGKSTRYVANGAALELGCSSDAQAMNINQVEQIATSSTL